jgi:hypothetical protein
MKNFFFNFCYFCYSLFFLFFDCFSHRFAQKNTTVAIQNIFTAGDSIFMA